MKILSRELQLVGQAQMIDVRFGQINYEPTFNEIIQVYKYKTARYSFVLPFLIGAVLAGVNNTQKLEKLGEELGIIFQLKDDDLGLTGDEKVTGKQLGSDIKENKKTLYRYYLYKLASKMEIKKLNKVFGQKPPSLQDIRYINNLIKNYKIDSKIKDILRLRKSKIDLLISEISITTAYKSLLSDLAEYSLKRDK